MKAVILAAGKGTRMGNLSHTTPKPLLKVLGKTLLEHKLKSMPPEITEVVIVVGHLKELITGTLGNNHDGKKITYVVQDELRGTGHSLLLCKKELENEDRFLVMMGDDIYTKADMQNCLETPWSVLVFKHPSIKGKAEVMVNKEGIVSKIQEKVPEDRAGLVCAGMYSITPDIFKYPLVAISETEFGLPQTIVSAGNDFKIYPIVSENWIQITEPADLIRAEKLLQKQA
jgi:bifunctional UDP-N-acetylglucosamine pyrophosphorylase/glucosamine-1-phosphate N-acetyltransferase